MYWVSRWAGRPIVMRYGKYFFIAPAKVEQAERWASQFGSFGIFASRLLPVVRHLIGIPAGIVRMSYLTFSIFTILGSGVWCAVLVWVGQKAGNDEALMRGELHRIGIWLVAALAVLGVIYYFFVHRYTRKAPEKK
jgi:membrane protein DedA with SNARE-associated domain